VLQKNDNISNCRNISRTDVFDRSVLSQELCETKPTYENADESFTQTDPGY